MSNELVVQENKGLQTNDWSQSQLELVRKMICKDATNDELDLFAQVCKKRNLDPFTKQIYFVKYAGKMSIITSIDGLRLVASRSGQYEGQVGPFWCGSDGVWKDVWLNQAPPVASKVGVMRKGFKEPLYSVALWSSYAQPSNSLWKKMPDVMLAKCAEGGALRKAFPEELSGLYVDEEMHQAASPDPRAAQVQARVSGTIENYPQVNAPVPSAPAKAIEAETVLPTVSVPNGSDYVFTFGKWTGKSITEISAEDLKSYVSFIKSSAAKDNKPVSGKAAEAIQEIERYLNPEPNVVIHERDEEPEFDRF